MKYRPQKLFGDRWKPIKLIHEWQAVEQGGYVAGRPPEQSRVRKMRPPLASSSKDRNNKR